MKVISLLYWELVPYLFLAKLRMQMQLAYRLEAFAGFASNIIPLLSMIFVWRAAYDGVGVVEGVSASQMITYTIISISIKDVFFCQVQENILAAVRNGSVEIDLIRPFNLLGGLLAEDLALSFGALMRRFFPLVIFSAIFFQLPTPVSASAFFVFVVSCFFSYALLWLLSALVGLIAFWWMELGNMGMVKDAIIRLLSGSIVPLWFFPGIIQDVSVFLPFQYTFQTPLSIYVGKLAVSESLTPVIIQMLWVLFFGVVLVIVWNKGKRKVLIQGG